MEFTMNNGIKWEVNQETKDGVVTMKSINSDEQLIELKQWMQLRLLVGGKNYFT